MAAAMRLGVYTDYIYRRADGIVYAERAFALFLGGTESRSRRASRKFSRG
jgi:hypothetical protein